MYFCFIPIPMSRVTESILFIALLLLSLGGVGEAQRAASLDQSCQNKASLEGVPSLVVATGPRMSWWWGDRHTARGAGRCVPLSGREVLLVLFSAVKIYLYCRVYFFEIPNLWRQFPKACINRVQRIFSAKNQPSYRSYHGIISCSGFAVQVHAAAQEG